MGKIISLTYLRRIVYRAFMKFRNIGTRTKKITRLFLTLCMLGCNYAVFRTSLVVAHWSIILPQEGLVFYPHWWNYWNVILGAWPKGEDWPDNVSGDHQLLLRGWGNVKRLYATIIIWWAKHCVALTISVTRWKWQPNRHRRFLAHRYLWDD